MTIYVDVYVYCEPFEFALTVLKWTEYCVVFIHTLREKIKKEYEKFIFK